LSTKGRQSGIGGEFAGGSALPKIMRCPEFEGSEMPDFAASAPQLEAALGHGHGLLETLLNAMTPEVSTELLTHATLRNVERGEIIVERGTQSAQIGYVLDGTLAMVQILEDNRKHIIGLLVPTDIFGRVFDGPSSYRVEALSAARILLFPRALFEHILRENPETERLFLVHLMDEMDAARDWLLLISGSKVINRVASFLTILLRRLRVDQPGARVRLQIPLARKDLSHYLGARPETLSRALHQLERDGVIRIVEPNVFDILDEAALTAATGDDLTIEEAKVPRSGR
jgi:CRP/FNR family transcriptional regulator, anaerobic regulatory protein